MSLSVSRKRSLRSFSAIGVLLKCLWPDNTGLLKFVPTGGASEKRRARACASRQGETSPEVLAAVSVDGAIGQKQLPALTPLYPGLDVVEQKPHGTVPLAKFAGAL